MVDHRKVGPPFTGQVVSRLNLHLRDFFWFAQMQMARCISISSQQPRGGDQVLERLLEEGIFNQAELNTPHAVEEFCMAHVATIGQRLLAT